MNRFTPASRKHLPHECGVYLMRDSGGTILYIGKAIDLAKRVAHYFNPQKEDIKNSSMMPLVRSIDYVLCASEREALVLERRLISQNQPFFNVMWKDGKTYPYLKITLGEDFPRMLLTRRKINDGSTYFGPFPKVGPIRSLLRYLWRLKFFPLRPCRWEFDTQHPLDVRKIRACLYYHTRECPAPCAERINQKNYHRIAEQATLFFSGNYRELRSRFLMEMKEASSRMDYERAAQLRDNELALSLMGERVRVRAVSARDVGGSIAASRGVTDLQHVLGLERPPARIECFDISHFAGRQTVAAMVSFRGGEPDRANYRKFRIRNTVGVDDFQSIHEAVLRRYRRLRAEKAHLPDLIVIDGGKGQLNAALAALKEAQVNIPVVSLAKRVEEVFLAARTQSLILPLESPALQLLQRLRDEAHRFGLSYHRLLRGKALSGV